MYHVWVSEDKKSHDDAASACQSDGKELVRLSNDEEYMVSSFEWISKYHRRPVTQPQEDF